ncbi:hypothetical protein ACOMHN_043233 [Nucella lapillus]
MLNVYFFSQVGFSRGAGSQLMLSAMSTRSQYDVVEEQARELLNREEQATLRYYLAQYSRGGVTVPGFVAALRELFNTGAKSSAGSRAAAHDTDSLSLISADSADAFMDDHHKRTLFSTKQIDDPSDDSGVDVNQPPHPLDPRAFLSLDG